MGVSARARAFSKTACIDQVVRTMIAKNAHEERNMAITV